MPPSLGASFRRREPATLLEEPQAVTNGRVRPTESPGTGLRFDAEALAPYLVT